MNYDDYKKINKWFYLFEKIIIIKIINSRMVFRVWVEKVNVK